MQGTRSSGKAPSVCIRSSSHTLATLLSRPSYSFPRPELRSGSDLCDLLHETIVGGAGFMLPNADLNPEAYLNAAFVGDLQGFPALVSDSLSVFGTYV